MVCSIRVGLITAQEPLLIASGVGRVQLANGLLKLGSAAGEQLLIEMVVELVELHVALGDHFLEADRLLGFRRYVKFKSILVVEAR